jgi:hypothetical protein
MATITIPSAPSSTTPEIPLDTYKPQGYHKLAALVGPNFEIAIFRRFSSLNMLNLLSLQAELVDLEVELKDVVLEDEHSDDPERRHFSVDFWKLRRASDHESNLQCQVLLRIRNKLNEYSSNPTFLRFV